MKTTMVKISGPVGCMKSPIAEKIRRACEREGLTCSVIDHRYFVFDGDCNEEIAREASESDADVTVFVIGTGSSARKFLIEVEPAHAGVMQLFSLMSRE